MKVIANKQLPVRLPFSSTIAVGLLLDRLNAPGWVWGSLGLLYAMLWAGAIACLINQTEAKIDLR